MLGENAYHYKRGIYTLYKPEYNRVIVEKNRDKLFNDADYIFVNFEYSLFPQLLKPAKLEDSVYRADCDSLSFFPKDKKIIVNVANNHFSQHGVKSALFSKEQLKLNKLCVVGEDLNPLVINEQDRTIYFWSASLVPDSKFCGQYNLLTYETLLGSIELKKKDNDFWIVSLHWGDEYTSVPSKKQINLAEELVDIGFDLIVGHHPHVIQPIEKLKETYIFYSLGNFIFDQNFSSKTRKGMAVRTCINDNLSIEKIYLTKQDKSSYKLEGLSETTFERIKINKKKAFYKQRLFFIDKFYRLLMKIEVLKNFRKVNKETIKFLLKRFYNFNKN